MAMEFKREDFARWVEQGLNISHAKNFNIDEESLLPGAPVAFAFVTESAAVAVPAHVQVKMPAMIPLPMNRFAVKADAMATTHAVHVYYKATWSVRFVKPGNLCDVFLVIPPPRSRDYLGALGMFRIEIPSCSKPAIKPIQTNRHTFDDLFFIQRSQVDGGAEVRSFFHFFVRMHPWDIGAFTFEIPLNFPSYTKGFRAETQEEKLQLVPISETRRFKIKISLGARRNGSILSYSLNFPCLVRSKYEGDNYLLHKSEGVDVEWPDKPLSCTFICGDKRAAGRKHSINEVVKPPLKMAVGFGGENFEELVERGLEVSHGENLDILSDAKDTLFPKALVAFAFVTESAAIDAPDHVEVRVPALIPLLMNRLAVEANALLPSNVVHVSYKASWFVRFVKIGHLCEIFLVVPPPCTAGGKGVLDNFKMEIPSCSKLDVKPYCTDERTFHGAYFIRRSQVDGGAEVRASFQFSVQLFPSTDGIFCFRIPLKFPFYAKGFRPEKQFQPICIKKNELISKSRRCKIRIFLSAGVGQIIQKCSLDFPHSVISKSEEHKSLLHMSEGPDVEWPGRPLLCIFICVDKQAAGSDSMTDEVVEPSQKKMRLPTEEAS